MGIRSVSSYVYEKEENKAELEPHPTLTLRFVCKVFGELKARRLVGPVQPKLYWELTLFQSRGQSLEKLFGIWVLYTSIFHISNYISNIINIPIYSIFRSYSCIFLRDEAIMPA